MSRPGVTFAEVSEAASQLTGQGKNPTIEQVRLILGTGSSTTIANHLREWKDGQSGNTLVAAKDNIPDEIITAVKILWGRLITLADDKVQTVTTDYQAALMDIQDDLVKYRRNNQRWQQLYQQWNLEKERLVEEKRGLEKAAANLRQEHDAVQTQCALGKQQLIEKQDRIQELRVLHEQSQKNLENFRESTREQRQNEQRQFDAQKQDLQSTIEKLQTQLAQLQNTFTNLQQQHHKLEDDHHRLQGDNANAVKTLKIRDQELSASEKNHIKQMHAAEHWQEQYKDAQLTLAEKNNLYIQTQAELKASQKQQAASSVALNQAHEKIRQLDQEKMELLQAKSLLQGQLKQRALTTECA